MARHTGVCMSERPKAGYTEREEAVFLRLRKDAATTHGLVEAVFGPLTKNTPANATNIVCSLARKLATKAKKNAEPWTIINVVGRGRSGGVWVLKTDHDNAKRKSGKNNGKPRALAS